MSFTRLIHYEVWIDFNWKELKKYLTLFVAFFLFAFKSTAQNMAALAGYYVKEGKDYKWGLLLNGDSTFVLRFQGFEVDSWCRGVCQYKSNSAYLLRCKVSTEPFEELGSGYMQVKEHEVKILNKKKVSMDGIVLKKRDFDSVSEK